jgi:cell wall-associated NlpC family hydrolase
VPEATTPARAARRARRLTRAAAALVALCGLLAGPGLLAAPAAAPAGLAGLRAEAAATRARLEAQNERLEVLAEQIEAAYDRGRRLLAETAALDARRHEAGADLAAAQADLDERARSAYMAGPGWFAGELLGDTAPGDLLARFRAQRAVLDADVAALRRVEAAKQRLDGARERLAARLVEQARTAEGLDAKRAEAERLAARLTSELAGMDRRVAALIDGEQRQEEAGRRAAFARHLAEARARGLAPGAGGRAAPAARRAVAVALAQLGAPYQWGAEGPLRFDCSGLTSFAYAAAGVAIPRTSAAQFAAYAPVRPVDPVHLVPGDLVFFGSPVHHVGMYVGRGLMVEAPHTGAVVRTASIWRRDYAGAARPVPAP